jgi:hypothetical protein
MSCMDETVLAHRKIWSLRVVEPEEPAAENVPAWEMIESGRYMPRRIRGSFPGRELG